MPASAPARLIVGAALVFGSVLSGAQTAAPGNKGIAMQGGASVTPGALVAPQEPFAGSVPEGVATPGTLRLSLKDAIDRGLKHNLGALLSSDAIIATRGQWWKQRSTLLPNLNAASSVAARQIDLNAGGLDVAAFKAIGVNVPPVVGPFGVYDVRAYLSQTVFDWQLMEQTRSDAQHLRAAQYTFNDARELVVFAVTTAYLQTVADSARVETALAQQQTAQALYQQAEDQKKAGTAARIDVLRANVELQAREQQLIAARNDLAKQKIVLERVIGLPSGQEFTLTDTEMYSPPPVLSLQEARQRAYTARADYQSALAQLRAAELAHKAAVAGYYPSLSSSVDYGDIGVTADGSHGTLNAAVELKVPIFQGGRVHGEVLEADAILKQSRELLANLRAQIDQEVRNAFLDLQSSSDQVTVARSSLDLANQTLQQARDRFAAGVTDNIEVVQAQQSVASANESLIASLYAYNVAKVELERAIGHAEASVPQVLQGR